MPTGTVGVDRKPIGTVGVRHTPMGMKGEEAEGMQGPINETGIRVEEI